MTVVRVALIGTGGIAAAHVEGIRAQGTRAELVAAYNPREDSVKQFCQEHSVAGHYTNLDDMLKTETPDLVCITSPPDVHVEQCIACMEAGAWVLCEKPLCGSLADFDRISAAEDKTGCYVSTIFQWRFGSAAQHIKALIDAGAFGDPLLGLCQTMWYRDQRYYDVYWRGKWETELGGTMMGHGIHHIDLMLWLKNDWHSVFARIATRDRQIEVENIGLGLVQFADGTLANIASSAASPRQESYVRLDFQKATVEVRGLYQADNDNWHITLPDGSDKQGQLAQWQTIPTNIPGSHAPQIEAVLDSMANQTRPPVSGEDGRRSLEFVASFYKSAFTGQPVERGSMTENDPFYHTMNGKIS